MAGLEPGAGGNSSNTHIARFFQLHTESHLIVSTWTTSGVYGLTAAMLTAIILSVTYECIDGYLMYLRNKALSRKTGSECCGVPVVSCSEKLLQTLMHLLRVVIGYILMLCVMTMNVWLLISVVVGAVVGYGVGKPLVANAILDIISSHEYNVANVKMSYGKTNPSQRSMSWRYRPIGTLEMDPRRLREEIELLNDAGNETHDDVFGNGNVNSPAEIIWIRRSQTEIHKIGSDVLQHDDVQLRHGNKTKKVVPKTDQYDTLNSAKTDDSSLSRSSSRFKATSKVINDSFRTSKSERGRQSLSRDSTFNSPGSVSSRESALRNSPTSSPGRFNRRGVGRSASTASHTSGNVSFDRGSSKTGGRFKPISRQISREINSHVLVRQPSNTDSLNRSAS